MRENEIRRQDLIGAQTEAYARDVARLLQKRSEFVEVPCPACNGSRREVAFNKYDLEYGSCCDCETVYVSPRPTPEMLAEYYATSENYAYWNKHIFPASEQARRAKIFRPRAKRLVEVCRAHGVKIGTLLEVGSGYGTFCEELRELGVVSRIVAVEPTPDLAATCRARGLEVIERPIEALEEGELKCDVIASFEVIEHLYSPIDFVRQCQRLLVPGGLLILTCPNIRGFDVATLREKSITVDTEHLNYFHPASMKQLLGRGGFEVLEVMTPGELDAELVRKAVLAQEIDLKGQPFLSRVLVDEWDTLGARFQQFLKDNALSSHMWTVARRQA